MFRVTKKIKKCHSMLFNWRKNKTQNSRSSSHNLQNQLEVMKNQTDWDMNMQLIELISREEIQKVAFSINPTKALGEDGDGALLSGLLECNWR